MLITSCFVGATPTLGRKRFTQMEPQSYDKKTYRYTNNKFENLESNAYIITSLLWIGT